MRMHNPPHPGKVLKTLCLEPLKVSVTEAAKALGERARGPPERHRQRDPADLP